MFIINHKGPCFVVDFYAAFNKTFGHTINEYMIALKFYALKRYHLKNTPRDWY